MGLLFLHSVARSGILLASAARVDVAHVGVVGIARSPSYVGMAGARPDD